DGATAVQHEVRVDLHADPKPVATGARPIGAVEGEHAGRQLFETRAAVGARQLLAKKHGVATDDIYHHDAVGPPQGGFQGVGQARFDAGPHDEPVDDDLDGVLLVFVELDLLGELPQLTVDPYPHKAFAAQLLQQLAVLALAAPHDGREDLQARPLAQGHDPVHDLLHRLLLDGPAALPAVGVADAGIQQPQVVVDLGHGAHRGPGLAAGRLRVGGYGRRQALGEARDARV